MVQKEEWSNLKAIGAVTTKMIKNDETSTFTRYFITSLDDISTYAMLYVSIGGLKINFIGAWMWLLVRILAKQKKDNSPLNLNVLRKTALSLLKQIDLGRIGLKKKMFQAALNTDVLERIIAGKK